MDAEDVGIDNPLVEDDDDEDVNPFEDSVKSLHWAFVNWFTAKPSEQQLPVDNKKVMLQTYCGQHLADDFFMITPEGDHIEKSTVVQNLLHAHGIHTQTGFEITIENFRVLHEYTTANNNTLAVVVYDEIQRKGHSDKIGSTSRRSTALLEMDGQSQDVIWKHVHETWMKGKDPESVVDGGNSRKRAAAETGSPTSSS